MSKATIKNTRSSKGNISAQGDKAKLAALNDVIQDSFAFYFEQFSSNLYVLRATDFTHELHCEMVLEVKKILVSLEEEVEDGAYLAPVVACSFPSISLQKLNEKTGLDAYLQGILMFQFQLKILERLFLFCEQKEAVKLILTIHETNLDYLDIYRRFFVSEEHVITSRGEQTQVVIPTDVNTYDEIVDFMGELDKDFRKILWRGQTANPAFRAYLKGHSLSVI